MWVVLIVSVIVSFVGFGPVCMYLLKVLFRKSDSFCFRWVGGWFSSVYSG